ncbi:CinA family nicotinamide mononucleotide deamidase-related protein [Pinibacter aurantiacus]|uniref:CinA-like protein n=1 Tax=Pinibacter aurantiacus TaxID=2851599 RepID=A0A9E2SCI3_9BACT|nr:CinA family nicotinamide mononucleotide deamidase-related protein [Pinibacter aurantiacus]MBV4360471.1 CinA family nicotinamide mononucleotide deamidase-related protein [Pinibacter aurantiacus]
MIQASIITIGDELLIGQVIDTNSAWIAQQLNAIGVPVKRRVAVGDTWDAIWEALDEEGKHSDIILITGGLGPTADDITKPLLCKYFNGKMVRDEKVLAHVKHLFEQVFRRPWIERNAQQADVPDTCTVLFNSVGTAPGMMFEKEGKVFISMPGVPFEMQTIMREHVLKLLPERFKMAHIAHRTLLTAGIGESFLAERIKDFEEKLPSNIKLAYLPSYGMVRLRLTDTGYDVDAIEKEINEQFAILQTLIPDVLVTNIDEPMETVVGKLLLSKKQTVGTAESCTGGYIAHLITSHAGSSGYFKGSVVSYDNDVKTDLLGVTNETLQTTGAVSEETVTQMVKGALQQLKTDYAVAVSGIMGPDGGSAEKPVGTVWVAVGNHKKITTQKLWFRYERKRNIELTAINALNLLRKFILENS